MDENDQNGSSRVNAPAAATPAPATSTTVETRKTSDTSVSGDWKTKIERFGASIAIVAILIGNIAKILDGVKTILDKIGVTLTGLKRPAIPTGILIVFIVVGYLVVFLILRRRAEARGSLHRRALVIGAVVCVAAFGGNAWLLLQERLSNQHVDKIQETWSKRLLYIQAQGSKGDSGGFRYTLTPNPQSYPDAWSTAQCLRAIIMSSDDLASIAGKLRDAFRFILSQRVKGSPGAPRVGIGWVTIPDQHIKNPNKITRTEISSWVALAYAAALKSHAVWTDQDQAAQAQNILAGLVADLVARQGDDGSWGASYRPVRPEAQRVYSSALALWALVEARSLLHSKGPNVQIDRSIYKGTEWLINVYQPNKGWNPEAIVTDDPDVFPALTAQVLFILRLATSTNAADQLRSTLKYQSARQQFPDLLQQCRRIPSNVPVENETQNTQKQKDEDLYGGEDMNVHFVEYPWSLAILETLKRDPDLSSSQRRTAASLEEQYISQLDDLENRFSSGMTYVLAEHLIGLTYVEAIRFNHANTPFLVPTTRETN